MIFRSHIYGQDCLIRVLEWEKFIPGRLSGPPEDCYPNEGGYGAWEVLDLKGKPDHDLVQHMTADDEHRIDREVFKFMEGEDQ